MIEFGRFFLSVVILAISAGNIVFLLYKTNAKKLKEEESEEISKKDVYVLFMTASFIISFLFIACFSVFTETYYKSNLNLISKNVEIYPLEKIEEDIYMMANVTYMGEYAYFCISQEKNGLKVNYILDSKNIVLDNNRLNIPYKQIITYYKKYNLLQQLLTAKKEFLLAEESVVISEDCIKFEVKSFLDKK